MKRRRQSQPKTRRSQKRRINRFRLFAVVSVVDVLLLVFTILLLPSALDSPNKKDKPSALGVRSVTVEGNTQYDNDAIVAISGIRVGQSVFSVNKGQAVKKIKNTFSYVEEVKVAVGLSRNVVIRITEAEEMGAVYADGSWIVVDAEGKGLLRLPMESERPLRRLYLKGAQVVSSELGKQVLSDRSLAIVSEIFEAFELYELGDVNEIDMTSLSDIRVNWKNQITIALGNDSNLTYEIAVAAATIPKVLDRHGASASGVLNVSQYSDKTIETPSIIFTPS